jgi:hypothetical protein
VRTSIIAASGLLFGWVTALLPGVAIIGAIREPGPAGIAAASIAVLAATAALATQVALARHFRIPFWYGLLLPLSCSAGALLAACGVFRNLHGQGAMERPNLLLRERRRRIGRWPISADELK